MAFSLEQFQRHLMLAGYRLRDVPVVERADLFSTKGGDRVIEHLLTFDHGNSEYALRPEFTASAARAYAAVPESVVRWQFSGPVFEDRAGNGDHAFQRHSIGVELLGMAGPLADSEIIGLAISGLQAQGISDFQLVIGHAGLTRKLIERTTTDPQFIQFLLNQRAALSDPSQGREAVEKALNRLLNLRGKGGKLDSAADNDGLSELLASVTLRTSTLGGRTRDDIARRLLRKQHRTEEISQILRGVETLETWVSLNGAPSTVLPQIYQLGEDAPEFAAMAADLRTTLDLLEAFGVASETVVLQPDLNRIWEYYSGIVFEIQTPDGISLGGGGRYDGLLRLLGSAEDAPAVGFQLNADAVSKAAGRAKHDEPITVLVGGRSHALLLMQWASALRASGLACEVYESEPEHTQSAVFIDADGARVNGKLFAVVDELVAFLQEQPLQ